MAGGFQSDDEIVSGINVTPLVDVVLVLLVIFLITAPMMYQSSIPLQLPKAVTGKEEKTEQHRFTIDAKGQFYYQNKAVNLEDIIQKIRALGVNISNETAFISADKKVEHGRVVELIDTLRNIGMTKVALNVDAQ